jgi:hypothetical protein
MTKSKKRMGRPKLPKNQARGVFSIRCSALERKQIEAAAKRTGKKPTEWARIALLRDSSQT